MTDPSSLFSSTQNQLLTTESLIQQYESGNYSQEQQQLIQYQLNNIQRNLQQLQQSIHSEHITRQSQLKARVYNLNERYTLMAQNFQQIQNRVKRSTNDIRIDLMPNLNNRQRNTNGLDSLSRENNSLNRIHKQIDEQLDMSSYAYNSLINQRDLLKNTQRKALDVVNVLGLSSTVLRLADRYDRMNAVIVYSCMIVTLIVLFVTYYYFRYLPANT